MGKKDRTGICRGGTCRIGVLLCMTLAGDALGGVNTPRMQDYVLPHAPSTPADLLSREGTLWVEGALLSSPCSSGRVVTGAMATGVVKTQASSVALLLEGCDAGASGGEARLPVTIDVMSGSQYLMPRPQTRQLSPGSTLLPLTVEPDAQVLRVEMRYE